MWPCVWVGIGYVSASVTMPAGESQQMPLLCRDKWGPMITRNGGVTGLSLFFYFFFGTFINY